MSQKKGQLLMRIITVVRTAFTTGVVAALLAGTVDATPPSDRSWTLQWADEFTGTIDMNRWHYWNDNSWRDNNGHHVYLSGAKCISDSNGCAIIKGVLEGTTYYSAGLETNQGYGPGYYEARVKAGHAWAAFWVQGIGGDCTPITAGCEFDIMENCCPGLMQHNIHWGGYGTCHQMAQGNANCSQDSFNVFGLQWSTQTGATFYVNGKVSHTVPSATPNNTGVVRLTVESENVGQEFQTDYVRYYKDNGPATGLIHGMINGNRSVMADNGIIKSVNGRLAISQDPRRSIKDLTVYDIRGSVVANESIGFGGVVHVLQPTSRMLLAKFVPSGR
jgi:hypothetical protein